MLLGASRALSLVPPLPVVVIAISALVTAVAIQISNTLWETVLQQRIPQAALSRVSSYDWMVSLAFQPVAFVIIGPLADTIGNVPTLLLSAALGLAANVAALMVPSIRNMRRLDRDDAVEPSGEVSQPVSTGNPVP
jgi:MFS family permease